MGSKVTIVALLAAAIAGSAITRRFQKSFERISIGGEEDGGFERFHKLNEHEEAQELEQLGGAEPVVLHTIHFGDLSIPCPICKTEAEALGVGLSTVEDRETDAEKEFNDLQSVGVLVYPCGHVVFSLCLFEKVANIMHAEELGKLEPAMFDNITYCEEHHGDSEE